MPDQEEWLRRWPWLRRIIGAEYLPLTPEGFELHDAVVIREETADRGLMYSRPDDVGLVDTSWIGAARKPYDRARQAQYLYVVDAHESWRIRRWQYVRDAFREIPADEVQQVVLVSVRYWYKQPTEEQDALGRSFGAFVRREMTITVYSPPADGFGRLSETATLADSYLTTSEVITGYVRQDSEWMSVTRELERLAEMFTGRVFQNGLWGLIDASRMKGMSGTFGGVRLLSYVMCGRVRLTLQGSEAHVTFQGLEDEPEKGVGWQGVGGSIPEVTQLVEAVAQAWETMSGPERAAQYQDDNKVGIL